jgi:hypothetical protein
MDDDQESGLAGVALELPHRAAEQVLERPDPVLSVHAGPVVGLALGELDGCFQAREIVPVAVSRSDASVGPRAIMASAKPSMYDQCSSSRAPSARSASVPGASRLKTKKSIRGPA